MAISRRTAIKALLASGVGALSGAGTYGFLYERHTLEQTEVTIKVAGLSKRLVGLRIGLITDTHRSRWVSAEDIRHAAATLMSLRPDLIVLGGDYVTWGDRRFGGRYFRRAGHSRNDAPQD